MWRGTTPTHIFTLPKEYKVSDFSAVYVSYWQNGAVVLEKTGTDISATDTGFEIHLSQQDTLLFEQGPVKIQLRAKFPNGEAIASDIISSTAKEILKDGVI